MRLCGWKIGGNSARQWTLTVGGTLCSTQRSDRSRAYCGYYQFPCGEDRLLFAVAYQGKVGAVDRLTAQLLWSRDLSSLVGLSTDGGYVYVTHAQDSVYALDYQSGKSFWRQGLLQYRRLTVPLSMGQW